jgi:putative exosortase-associated protein (TIGR04073 family)
VFKKILSLAIVMMLAASLATPGYCDTAIQKLGRGLSNALGAPYELFIQPCKQNSERGMTSAIVVGIPKGVAMTLVRELAGLYEIGTFLIPIPPCYKPIMKDEPQILIKCLKWDNCTK